MEAPTRKEPTLEISEFHLTQPETRKKTTKVKINDLVKVLNKRSKHDALTNKLKQSQIHSKTLLKPLEKPQAERVSCINDSSRLYFVRCMYFVLWIFNNMFKTYTFSCFSLL